VQIATKFGSAPFARLLPAFAGVVCILATVTFAVGSPTDLGAVLSCSAEGARPTRPGRVAGQEPASCSGPART
jgi:hypothetical protein